MSVAFDLILAAIASEPWFEQFVIVTGLVLFAAWIVGMLTVTRFVAIPAGACLAAHFQIMFVWADSSATLYGSPLYSHFVLRMISCIVAVGLAVVGTSILLRASSSGRTQLARAALAAFLATAFAFEFMDIMTRLLAFFPDSPSLNRTWEKGLVNSLIVFSVVWSATLIYFGEVHGLSSPGHQDEVEGAIGPRTIS